MERLLSKAKENDLIADTIINFEMIQQAWLRIWVVCRNVLLDGRCGKLWESLDNVWVEGILQNFGWMILCWRCSCYGGSMSEADQKLGLVLENSSLQSL